MADGTSTSEVGGKVVDFGVMVLDDDVALGAIDVMYSCRRHIEVDQEAHSQGLRPRLARHNVGHSAPDCLALCPALRSGTLAFSLSFNGNRTMLHSNASCIYRYKQGYNRKTPMILALPLLWGPAGDIHICAMGTSWRYAQ